MPKLFSARSLQLILAIALLLSLVLMAVPAYAADACNDAYDTCLDSSFCGFPLGINYPTDNEIVNFHPVPFGTIVLLTGHETATATNVNTGYTISLNVSGPAQSIRFLDGDRHLRYEGSWLTWLTPGQTFGLPTVFWNRGTITKEFAPYPNLVSVTQTGNLIDICQALQ